MSVVQRSPSRPLAVAGLVTVLATSASSAAPTSWAVGTANLFQVCIVALLAPEELPRALSERGLADAGPMHVPPGFDGTVYAGDDGKRGVTVSYQRYSDLRITVCSVAIGTSASYDDLIGLRVLIEGDRHVGKLEGRILTATPTVRLGSFKKPGNAPIVTFTFTTSATTTSLVMSRMDLQPES